MNPTPYRWKPGLPADKHRRRLNAKAAAGMISALMTGRPTIPELVESSGLCVHTVRAYVKALHLAGAVHIVAWEQNGRGAYTTPRWRAGQGVDMPKPPPVDHNALQRAYRRVAVLKAQGFRPPRAADLARAAA